MKLNNYPLGKKDNIVVQEAGEEVLLYDLSDNKAYCLNETSAMVWELCDGNSSITDISQKMSKKLNQNADENLVWLALDQLKKEKLLANHEDIKIDFNGLSRRDAIRKVGFASLVALPVIMALHTPASATAQSVCGVPNNFLAGCQCNDLGCTILGGVMATVPNNTVCTVAGGTNCQQFGAACNCVSTGVCVGTTGQVNGTCR